jgi:F0F1-type ATP synthase assembly protein I
MENKEQVQNEETQEEEKTKVRQVVEAVDGLSLGISMVVAVIMGVGIGLVLKSWTGASWTLWIGIFIGVAAAILNVYKAYEKQRDGYEDLLKEPRYAIKKKLEDDEDDYDYGENKY